MWQEDDENDSYFHNHKIRSLDNTYNLVHPDDLGMDYLAFDDHGDSTAKLHLQCANKIKNQVKTPQSLYNHHVIDQNRKPTR